MLYILIIVQLKYINTLAYLKKNQFFFILLLFWSVLWTSLNSYPVEIFPISLKKEFKIYDIFKLIFNSRIYIPLIFTNIVLIILLFKIQLFKKNYFLIIYILFFLSQLIGIALYDFKNFNMERIYLVIQAFNALLILYIANNILDEEQIKKFFLINFSFLIIITIIYLPIIYIDYFNNTNFYLYGSQTWSEYFMNENIIRVTGLARIIALIAIILFVKLNNHISNFSKLILIILLIFFGITIWGLQSRLTFLCLTVVLFIYFTLFLRKNILKYFITIFIISFFSVEGFNTIANFKYLNSVTHVKKILDDKSLKDIATKLKLPVTDVEKILDDKGLKDIATKLKLPVTDVEKILNEKSLKDISTKNQDRKKIEDIASKLKLSATDVEKILSKERKNQESRLKKTFNAFKDGQHVTGKNTVVDTLEYVSSARTLIWNKIIKNYEYKRLFGYGPQADRHVILKIKKKDPGPGGFMSNASSSFFYAFICGGYFSLFLLILLNIHALYLMFIYLRNKIYKNNNSIVIKSTFLVLIFLMIRSIFENSYSLFSLDYLLFVSSIIIFEKLLKNDKINPYKISTLHS